MTPTTLIKKMAPTPLNKTICVKPAPELPVFSERCEGFGKAMDDKGSEYLRQVVVPSTSSFIAISDFVPAVEKEACTSNEWGTVMGSSLLLFCSFLLNINSDVLPFRRRLGSRHIGDLGGNTKKSTFT